MGRHESGLPATIHYFYSWFIWFSIIYYFIYIIIHKIIYKILSITSYAVYIILNNIIIGAKYHLKTPLYCIVSSKGSFKVVPLRKSFHISAPVPEFGQRGRIQDALLRASRVQIPPGALRSESPDIRNYNYNYNYNICNY